MTTGTVLIANREIKYSVQESLRAKRMRIAIYPGDKVVVTMPHTLNQDLVEHFLTEKSDWVIKKLDERTVVKSPDLLDHSYKHFLFNRGEARNLVRAKLAKWNDVYNFEYKKISIKRLKSRWGSCSVHGNLSFNYKILFLPESLQDLIIVHELCHLKEKNHSQSFWRLVELSVPDYRSLQKKIKRL